MLIDSHAHLSHADFQDEIRPLLERAASSGIEAIINICTHPEEIERGFVLSKEYPWIFTAAATTPHDIEKEGEVFFSKMEKYARSGKLVAIGETGLDYHHYAHSKSLQQTFLRRYLQLARMAKLPIVIHCREAFADLFAIIDEEYAHFPGMLHCFTGTQEEAEEILRRGWLLSLSGIVTFKKSVELQEVAKRVPLDQLLIETDAPYLAPLPYRGKRNEPAFLLETAKFIAHLKDISLEQLAAATTSNARSFFHL